MNTWYLDTLDQIYDIVGEEDKVTALQAQLPVE